MSAMTSPPPKDLPIDPALLSLEDPQPAEDEFLENEDGEQDEESELSSGSESAYEEEDLDQPVASGSKVKSSASRSGKGKQDERNRDGKSKGRRKEAGDEEDDIFDRLAGYVGRVPRGGSVIPEGGVLHPDDAGQAGTGKKRKPKRARAQHKPTHEVSLLLSQSNLAFIQGQTQQAIEGFLEVIRLDPYIHSAWTSLGTLYDETGNLEAARQMRFCALHIEGDADGWRELAMEFKGVNQTDECLYCLRKALSKDPQDVMVLWEISAQYKAAGKMARALDAFKKILRHQPDTAHDFSLLTDLHPIVLETKQYRFGAEALRTAFDWHLETFSGPEDMESPEPNTMTLENVINLSDLLIKLDELEEVVVVIRRGQRWLQGRRDQKQYDLMEDDREFDGPLVTRVEKGKEKEDEERERHPLDISLRHRLALVRLKLGMDDEAKTHIEELLQLEPEPYINMFVELGNALIERKQWMKALECLAMLQENENIDDEPEWVLSMGICHHQLKNNTAALEALRWVVSVQPDNLDARLKLANVLEDIGQKAEALDIVSEVLRLRAQDAVVVRGRGPTKQTKADKAASQKLNKKVLEEQMKQKMRQMWEEVQEAEAGIAEGDLGALDRFIFAAGTMIENFRFAKSNFRKNRGVSRVSTRVNTRGRKNQRADVGSKAHEMQDRLERTLGVEEEEAPPEEESSEPKEKYVVVRQTEFHGLGCEEWLNLIVKYCCVLMVKNEEELATEILEHVLWAGLFYNRRSEVAIRLTIIACAMRTRSYTTIAEMCKRLAQGHQFRTEPFLLMLGCMGGGGIPAHAAWQDSKLQKFIHRELRMYDNVVRGLKFHYSVPAGRWTQEIQIGYSDRLDDNVPVEGEDEDELDEEDEETRPKRRTKAGVAWRKGARIPLEQINDPPEDYEEEAMDDDDEGTMAGGEGNNMGIGEIAVRPTVNSPTWNWLYGTWMLNSKSYQSALFYLLRAYEYDQYHPLLCLCIAQAYFGRSMVRQADNRNYFIAQGMAFLLRYRKLSPQDPVSLEEVDYNFGRAFNGIGVPHLAVKHYEKVLDSVKRRMEEYEEREDQEAVRTSSLVFEAGHNLMILYATHGSMSLVKEKSKWLAI